MATVTDKYFLYLKPGVDNEPLEPNGDSTFLLNNTTYAGYTGAGHALSSGATPAVNSDGGRMPFDISAVPAGTYTVYFRSYGVSGASKCYAHKNTNQGGYYGVVHPWQQWDSWVWVVSDPEIPIDGSESILALVAHHDDVAYDGIVIVDSAETNLPTGDLGYTSPLKRYNASRDGKEYHHYYNGKAYQAVLPNT